MDVQKLVVVGGLAALGWIGYSQLAEDDTVRARADEVACRGKVCTPELLKRHRTLFGWEFEYQTYGDRSRTLTVTCGRPFYVFGKYDCDVEGTNSAGDSRFDPAR